MTFIDNLVKLAQGEFSFWIAGKYVECMSGGTPQQQQGTKRVATYWKEGLGINSLDGCSENAPWSAAFVCWCMRQAGMALTDFAFSEGHHTYIRWAINNTKNQKLNKTYYGRRLTEYAPKPGDLIAKWRKEKGQLDPNITFDVQPDEPYAAHCDIVVSVSDAKIETIGGNVSQKVNITNYDAVNGILLPRKEFISILECRKG